ncbi:MAG: peptidoglycan DD-metalloendopeptidase family protein, partial [Deltaproteobacteria bacterium]|nr:peptidoglycan DD-metalloendopeptidase family protein [Deltaproteobacteria bacterium]
TILLLPRGKSGQARTINLSYRMLKWGGGILAASLLFWLVSLVVALEFSGDRYQRARLSSENALLLKEVGDMRTKFASAAETLQRVQQFAEKLRVMTDFPSDAPSAQSKMSMGGPSETEMAEEITAEGEEIASIDGEETGDSGSLEDLKANFEKLQRKLEQEERSLEELHSFLKERQTLLSSTPSIWPTRGWVASGYGYRVSPFTGMQQLHQGIDIATHRGTNIIAPADGVVTFAGMKKGYGNVLVIDHGYGIKTKYGHNSEVYVKSGDAIKRGTLIARVGTTGRTTGPHLHYEVWVNGIPADPMDFILN